MQNLIIIIVLLNISSYFITYTLWFMKTDLVVCKVIIHNAIFPLMQATAYDTLVIHKLVGNPFETNGSLWFNGFMLKHMR